MRLRLGAELVDTEGVGEALGRIDRQTTTRRPRRAASTPRAAATVVLPTPPDPQQTTTDASSSTDRNDAARLRRLAHRRTLPATRDPRARRRHDPAGDVGDVQLIERQRGRQAGRSPTAARAAARHGSSAARASAAAVSTSTSRGDRARCSVGGRQRLSLTASSTALTNTGASLTPTRSSIVNAVAIVSLTGVVSASVTRATWQRLGVGEHRQHVVGLGAHWPAAHGVAESGRRRQHRHGVTGGRAVDDDRVPVAAALELLDLAEHDEVVDARGGGGDDVDHPGGGEALGDPAEAVLTRRYSSSASGCRQGEQRDIADQLGERRLAVELDGDGTPPGVGRRTSEKRRYRGLADSPFPATTVTFAAESSGTTSTGSGGIFAQTSDRLADHRGGARPARRFPAGAGDGEGDGQGAAELGRIDVLLVSGLFDQIVVDAVEDAIDEAVEPTPRR